MNWRKASYSNGGADGCVEVGNDTQTVIVRDTKQSHLAEPDRTAVPFSADAWQTFTGSLR